MMWNLPKGTAFLPTISLQQLKKAYKAEKKSKPRVRLLAAIHRKNGKSLDYICESLSTARTTVHDWLHRFIARGLSAKDNIKQPGKPPKLTKKQIKALIKDLERGPQHNKSGLWATKNVRELLKRKYHVSFGHAHVWKILNGFGFTIQRPRKKHYKSASPEEIKQFKKKLNRRQDTTERKVLLWARKMKPHSA